MWLSLILVGIVLILFGVFVEAAKLLIWLGLILLIISAVVSVLQKIGEKA